MPLALSDILEFVATACFVAWLVLWVRCSATVCGPVRRNATVGGSWGCRILEDLAVAAALALSIVLTFLGSPQAAGAGAHEGNPEYGKQENLIIHLASLDHGHWNNHEFRVKESITVSRIDDPAIPQAA